MIFAKIQFERTKAMEKKKMIQIGALAVAAIWVFCISFLIASSQVKKQRNQNTTLSSLLPASSSAQPSESTAAQTKYTMNGNQVSTSVSVSDPAWVVEESKSKQSSEAASIAEEIKNSSKVAEKKDSIPKTKSEVISAYTEAVNKLKSTASFTLVKQDTLTVEIDDISGGSSVQNIASSMIKNNTNTDPVTYNFSNGTDPSTGKSPSAVIAPLGSNASLGESIVTSATATENSGGGYKIVIKLGKAVQTLSSPAEGYSTSMEVINTDSLGLPSSAKITTLNITYDNSTIEADIDQSGRITAMTHNLVVSEANGEGKMLVSITVALHGNFVSTYKITY